MRQGGHERIDVDFPWPTKRACAAGDACIGWRGTVRAGNRPATVATLSILHDYVTEVADSRRVAALMRANGDTHACQATPVGAPAIARAGLLVSNGPGFEKWRNRADHQGGSRKQTKSLLLKRSMIIPSP